ncbi:Small RNA 2'-O-methyltransferase [Apophysomyces sp. BC1034]|nr:Small RNA 2'-O-methyltransferase [Apophysomyces sp. BC1015]KAG0182497.1 Small RNA 2'-O-methyltransferase [Apophysomyces sp. BC1021]KAG0193105.1 Small RNA 2'-O-methyltransferase [Apophysomyces sp. BC1034]
MEEDQIQSVSFNPPLWRQRRSFILETLKKHKITTVLDYGCGEASVLAFLIPPSTDDVHFIKLAGLDIEKDVLEEAIAACQPWDTDYSHLREKPLMIDIFQGSVDQPDRRLFGYEAIVCSEVIEHLYSPTLSGFFQVALGSYSPRLLIVTTPNAEYNVHFAALNYGQPDAIFRHDDHKFEWSRKEFETWCIAGATRYHYKVQFHGIGLVDGKSYDESTGYCTQACIFTRSEDHPGPIVPEAEPHQLLQHIEFPYYSEPTLPDYRIFEEIEGFMQNLCVAEECYAPQKSEPHLSGPWKEWYELNWIPSDSHELPTPPIVEKKNQWTRTPLQVPVAALWDILRIRQICGTVSCMTKLLSTHPDDYELQGEFIIVKKSFEILEDDDQDLIKSVSSDNESEGQ